MTQSLFVKDKRTKVKTSKLFVFPSLVHIPQSFSHRSFIVHQIGLSLLEMDRMGEKIIGCKFHKIDSKTNLFLFRHVSLEVLPMLKETKEEDRNDSVLHHH